MLSGTADPALLSADAPVVTEPATEPLHCRGVELLQLVYEVDAAAREEMLPPALHPVNPPALTWTVFSVEESGAGAFRLAECRIICRSGVRSRGFHVASFVDGADAGPLLARRWGYRVLDGEISFSRRHSGCTATVRAGGATALAVSLTHPEPLAASDIRFTAAMHLTRTAGDCRLIQVERAHEIRAAERGRPGLAAFDAAAWGEPRLRPSQPVSAFSMAGDLTLLPVRYVCRADVDALEGAQRVGR